MKRSSDEFSKLPQNWSPNSSSPPPPGRVKLASLMAPPSEFGGDHEKGDALSAMELVLSLEKLNLVRTTSMYNLLEFYLV